MKPHVKIQLAQEPYDSSNVAAHHSSSGMTFLLDINSPPLNHSVGADCVVQWWVAST